MSNVLAKNRYVSELEYYNTFIKILNKSYMYFNNRNKFDQNVFQIFCAPLLQTFAMIQQDLVIANSIFPTNDHEVMIRRDYQNLAIGKLEWSLNWIEFMITNLRISLEYEKELDQIIHLIYDDLKHIKIWRKKNNKLLKKYRELNSDNIGIVAAESKLIGSVT